MPGLNITVSLYEVLEVRGSPLTETEIWALLCMGAEALQDIFIAEQAANEFGPVFVINPDTFSLTPGGQVEFGHAQRVQQYANYMAPETEEGFVMTASAIEQIYVYALGKSLVYSAEFGLRPEEQNSSRNQSENRSKPLRISRGLESILGSMTSRNPAERIALVKVLEACSLQTARHKTGKQSLSHIALDLYRTVLGVEGQEDPAQDSHNVSDKSRPITTQQEIDPERSRRKKRRSRNSGKHKKRSPVQRYRSRSRSRSSSYSRSRSRSHSKQNGRGRGRRGADSPDSGYHRHSPSHDENYGRNSRPDLQSTAYNTGRSYHLSDITFSASQNGQNSKRKSSSRRPDSRQSRGGSRPQSNTNNRGSMKDNDIKENPAFKKYLRLKERQRKLRALRGGVMDSTESDELSDIVMDHMSETRSVMSLVSHNQGAYRPDIHKQYGSNSALRMGRESDLDSIVSTDTSVLAHDNLALRANGDISDPYIQQLQQMTAAPPPPPVFAAKPPVVKHKQKQSQPSKPSLPSKPPQKHKEFYGPEFVHRSTKPISRIAIPLQGESRKNPARVCRVVVVLLNGQKMEVMCDPSTTGQQLFEAIVTQVELPEFYFFGLTYVNDDEHFFIPAETKLHKVAPDGWKQSWNLNTGCSTFTVYLRVKFYVENIAALKHDTTRHQLYLQLRRDILEERCHCDETKALALTGLALQAEYGDYNQETMGRNYFVPEHYFPGRVVKRLGSGYVKDHTPEAHMDVKGLTETEAELEFIKVVQEELPEYGIHFHKLLKKKGDTSNIIWVGLNVNEMLLAENSGGQRIIVQRHSWGAIQKISFNRRRFSVQPRPDIGQVKPVKMNFFTTTYRKGQYLLKFCTAQHSFQLKMKSRLALLDGEAGMDAMTPDHESIGTTEDMDSGNTDDEGTITDEHISPREADIEMEAAQFAARDDVPQKQPVAYRNPPPYRPNSGVSLIDLPGPKVKESGHPARAASSEDVQHTGVVEPAEEEMIKPSQTSDTNQAYVIDTSTRSTDQTLFPPSGNETISNTLHQRFKDELLSPEPATAEREVFEVVLAKDPEFGFGITIIGGDNNREPNFGIFVKSVTVATPAHRDGRIKPGDRIVAINDCSTEGLPHHEAVNMIKNSSPEVKLKFSQIRPPRSLRKHDHDDFRTRMKAFSKGSVKDDLDSEINQIPLDKENSPSQDADDSSMPVITVQDCASVHSDDKNNENDKKIDEQMTSIPDGLNACEDHGRNLADVHSTLSQVDSLNSELADLELPVDEQNNIVEIPEESDTDSDFDDRIDAVINETPVVEEQFLAETVDKVSTTDRKSASSTETVMEVFEVFLEKKRGSFGLNVTGGVNTSVRYGGIYVKSVVPDGAADEEGTIRKGDRILMVDNKKLEGFTHKQAVETLCEAPAHCRLVLERGVIPRSRHSSTSSHQSQRSDRGLIEQQALKAAQMHPQVQRLRDEPPQSVVSESPTAQVKVLEMSLTSTTADDIADEAGEEDEQVAVDEMQIEQGLSQENRQHMIAVKQLYENFVLKENCYKVNLKKSMQGLGFSIVGGEADSDDGTLQYVTRIKRVFPIGPAADNKKIVAGDVILSVNGQDMRSLSHAETMMSLRRAGKTVTLILCRPDPEKLPPLPILENQESLELTPASSTADLTDTDSSESDSEDPADGDATPAREVLITPPTGYSPQKYPVDDAGSILPKVVSPPPPLPQSPPPALIRSGSVTPPSVTVELGVAELMDSCRSEMVKIHHSSAEKPDERDTTPVVREYSTLGFENSRETTPSVGSKRTTPINVVEFSTMDSEDFNNLGLNLGSLVSVSEKDSLSQEPVSDSPNEKPVIQSVLQRGEACDESDTESESTVSVATDKSTSLVDSRLGTYSQQDGLQSLTETDYQETSLLQTDTLENEGNSLTDLNACNDDTNMNECYIDGDYINVNEAQLDVNNDDIDNNIKLLEQKYSEIDDADENGDETESEESTSTDDEQSSVRETFSQMMDESLHTGEIEVTLTKPEGKGLGFTVAGGANTTGGCYIKAVIQNPALSDGTLKAGDRLIKVNGIDMRSLNHFEAVTVLREAANEVIIRVYREPKEDPDESYSQKHDDQALSEKGPEGQGKDEGIDGGTLETESLDEQDSESESDESSQDGEPTDRTSTLVGDGEPVCEDSEAVCQTEDRQPVQEEDSLVEEGRTKDMSPIQDLIESLEKSLTEAPALGRGEIGKNQSGDGLSQKEAFPSSPKSPRSPEVSVCHIDLEKPLSGGLGISLVTAETENQTGVFIRTISPGGVAQCDGRLSVGDKILRINGKSLIGLNHSKAAILLRNSEGRVTLTVSRNRGKKPVWLDADKEVDHKEAEDKEDKVITGHTDKKEDTDSDSENSEVEDENSEVQDESSLSLTKHLPGDIDDDNVEDLVREAERTLEDAKSELESDIVDKEIKSTEAVAHEDRSHRYLRAAETIEYHHDEIDIEADEQTDLLDEEEDSSKVSSEQQFEQRDENASDDDVKEQEDYDDDFVDYEDDNDEDENETNEQNKESDIESNMNEIDQKNLDDQNVNNGAIDIDDNNDDDNDSEGDAGDRCWCSSLRKLEIEVPDEVTSDWLYSLSLATIPDEVKSSIPGLIAELQEKMEVDEPQEEFKQLRTLEPTDECTAANLVHNRDKNRFRNVLPYDLNRVRLSDDNETDYINASFVQIDVSGIICDYIACQGPLPHTTDDFWEMIWQQEVTVVVMLTLDMEAMKVKCHRYWPDSVDTPIEVCDGSYRLSLLYLNVLDDFDIRNILIENMETEESRSIFHLNYTTWPDHGVPQSAVPLLQCMRLSHQLRASGPLVVHCSAGIGRTGTFITIDVALAHVEKSLKCEILDIVSELRRQRQGMIQTRDQYLFCYTACIEALLKNTS